MRLLLDTHALLWFVAGDDRLSPKAREAIQDASNERLLSLASVWEMAIKHSLGRLTLKQPFEDFLVTQADENKIEFLPIELNHILAVDSLPLHHRDPFDRLLIAQCLEEEFQLVSADSVMDAYGISRIW